ncbi:hypothetical protein C8F01DRAFT_1253295 [Mycena amicta]|nr:hypothetical protein C8F01DRAFT_1253295 [Mycena amicta]
MSKYPSENAPGPYYDPNVSQPAPAYRQGQSSFQGQSPYPGHPQAGQPQYYNSSQPQMQQYHGYNSSQPQMQPPPQPAIYVNVNQSQKQKGGGGCCAW